MSPVKERMKEKMEAALSLHFENSVCFICLRKVFCGLKLLNCDWKKSNVDASFEVLEVKKNLLCRYTKASLVTKP